MITHIYDKNFKKVVLNENRLVIVDFSAKWCKPCKMLRSILEEISDSYNNIRILSIDIDESPIVTDYFGVHSIPTLLFLKRGKVVDEMIGFSPKANIEEIIGNNL